jgi:hypothetical protein
MRLSRVKDVLLSESSLVAWHVTTEEEQSQRMTDQVEMNLLAADLLFVTVKVPVAESALGGWQIKIQEHQKHFSAGIIIDTLSFKTMN